MRAAIPVDVMRKKVVKKPWGGFEQFTLNEKTTVKILTFKPRQKLSLQSHKNRKEFWKVIEGNCVIWIGRKKVKAKPGQEFFVRKGQMHRVEALGKTVRVLEISFGKFDENDLKRVEDIYGRV